MMAAADLRILADDLTGALDAAAAFAGEVPVFFDRPPERTSHGASEAPVSAVATATRDLPPAQLPAALAPALPWLCDAGIAFKKVDSLLRGNSFAEVALAAATGRFERIVFAPAFPQQGRLTIDGRLVLAPPGAAAMPTGPMLHPALASIGSALDIPDVRGEADLLRIAQAASSSAARRWLWCGSAGLAHALARVLTLEARAPATPAGAGAAPLLLVSASHHPVARRQWARLLAQHPQAIVAREGQPGALQAALAAMQRPHELALLDLSPTAPLAAEAAASLLADQLRAVAQHAPRPGVLVVVGGDTLRGLCRATAARGLCASAAARTGWGQARWIGGPWDGLPCHSRSGAFGADDDLVQMLALLQRQG